MRATNSAALAVQPGIAAIDGVGGRERVAGRATLALLAACSAALAGALFLRLMNFDLRRDEELYVPPASLLDDHALYRDFFYNHTPGSAWLFHLLHRLLGSDHLLLDARLGVALGWLLFAVAIGAFGFVLTRSLVLSWSVTVLSLLNTLFLTQTGMAATNNFLPLPLSFIGLALFIFAVRRRSGAPWFVAAGFFLALAVTFKLSAVAFVLPAAAAALLLPEGLGLRRRVTHVLAPLALGGLIGGLPVLVYLALDARLFMAHVMGYHLGPHVLYYRQLAGGDEGAAMLTGDKAKLAGQAWLGTTVAFAALAALVAMRLRDAKPSIGLTVGERGPALLVLAAFGTSLTFSFIPTPSFPQYFAPPLACLPLGLVLLVAALSAPARRRATLLLTFAAMLAIAVQVPRLAQQVGTIADPGEWTVARTHRSGAALAHEIEKAGAEGKVATLAPIYPLEGGLDVYPEFATGPFVFRTAALTEPALGRFYRMVSPSQLGALFDADPPAAFLLGFDAVLEKPLLDHALAHGYRPLPGFQIQDRYGTGLLYLKTDAAERPLTRSEVFLARQPVAGRPQTGRSS